MNAVNAKRVLFVDDEEGVRTSWSRYLSDKGFDVATAEDGERAIASLQEKPADVVVSDLRMPGLDGLMLLEQLRESQPETPFILLTGYGDEELEGKARQLGVYEYLNKPISPEALSAVLTAALQLELQSKVEEPVAELGVAAAKAAHAAPAEMVAPALATPVAAEPRSQLRSALAVAGGVIVAPLAGLAFVIFMPVIGFLALFRVLGEAVWDVWGKVWGDEAPNG